MGSAVLVICGEDPELFKHRMLHVAVHACCGMVMLAVWLAQGGSLAMTTPY